MTEKEIVVYDNPPVPNPVPNPEFPVGISLDPVALVNGILDCYKNVKISQEEQMTRRMQIREQSKNCLAQIEADTKKFQDALNEKKELRMKYTDLICDLIRQKDIDDYSLQLCKMILDYLIQTDPMNALR